VRPSNQYHSPLNESMHVSGILRGSALLVLCLMLSSSRSEAQLIDARFGVGFNTLLSSEDGLGLGFRGRMAIPINADISFAFDAGMNGFVLNGRDDATYVFDPQASLIVTLPGVEHAAYIMGGMGAYANTSDSDGALSGPTFHFGIGWIRPLRESVLFYEIDPALVVGSRDVSVAIPFRIGIIF